mgnify:CR=1 FL=1
MYMIIMGIITFTVDDEVEKEFRRMVAKEGGKNGDLGKAVTEAMKKWIEENRQQRQNL